MPSPRKSTKARLIEAALDLFAERGVTETTTKAVAERAQVNEVTLFRNFGNKYRLLLAVIEDSAVFAKLVHALVERAKTKESLAEFLKEYAQESLHTLDKAPDLVRSVVGEAGNYPLENRLALGMGLTEANKYVAGHLAEAIASQELESRLTPEQIVNLLNVLLLGYFTVKSSTEGYTLWTEQDDFLDSLVTLFLQGTIATPSHRLLHPKRTETARTVGQLAKTKSQEKISTVADLPASLVRSLFKQAKKQGKQDYALAYILFGAGLSVTEILNLERNHSIVEPQQHILQIERGAIRQVPLNHWIMGFRYGSNTNNPLTQWLKIRKDEQNALFINELEEPMSEEELQTCWQIWTEDLLTPLGESPQIEQARQTWCVEMLMKGIGLEDLSILSGLDMEQLQPFARRAKNKTAIEAATRLDKPSSP